MHNLPAHLEHQCAIERDGIMVAAGPHWTDDEQSPAGVGNRRGRVIGWTGDENLRRILR